MLNKLIFFVLAVAFFPVKLAYNMHRMLWNYVLDYVKNTLGALRTS